MATLNFPDAPDTGDEYYDSNSGFNYEWNGTVWITKDLATVNNTREIDDISSGFDGSDTTFTLQINGVNIVPSKVEQLVISVGGVMQNPGDDYTVSGSTLTFTSAPSSGLSFTGTFLGVAASLNTITAGTVSPSSLTTTSNYTVGSIKVSGASTIGNFVLTGLTTITDPDVTNLSSSGVGTVSNVILTGDNSGLGATIGAAVGVVTYFGDASNMTGVALTIFPLSYSPGIGSTSQAVSTDITTTWNYPIQAGSGTITIRTGGGTGTIVDQFVVGSSSSITISGRSLTLNPAADLNEGTEHFVVYPAGSIKSTSGQKENNQLVTSFTTLTTTRQLWGWGKNNYGSLGINQAPAQLTGLSSPTQVGTDTTWSANMQGGARATYGIKTDGSLWSWGYNFAGILGLNSTTTLSSPTQVGTDTTWNKTRRTLASDQGYAVGSIKTDGTLWTWGRNDEGDLGQNSLTRLSSPTQVGTETTWSKVSMGNQNALAIKTDGTMWAWGNNNNGYLGLNETDQEYSSPVQLPGTTWNDVVSRSYNGFATKTDGTLWVTGGYNFYGTLGLNQAHGARISSPTQIGTNTTWANLPNNGGDDSIHMMATKTDGTLWVWGRGASGALGLNEGTPSEVSSPIQVGTDTTWSTCAFGYFESGALKTDGTLWTWGTNTQGAAGQNNVTKYSSPTQVGSGTKWDYISYGGDSLSALQLVQ